MTAAPATCTRVGCACCPTEAYCRQTATGPVTIRLPHTEPVTTDMCDSCQTSVRRTYTHPDVLTRGVREGWADPTTDPTRIDWPPRQARAALPFRVVDGRPISPGPPTGIRHGRNELGHWGEQLCADALVTATDETGRRWLVMVERADGHGWALPGGYVDPGETPGRAAVRELAEETGLHLTGAHWETLPARYVPDPRASDEAWMVTVPSRAHLGTLPRRDFPVPAGADDARRAEWVTADTRAALAHHIETTYGTDVFPAHWAMLDDLLTPEVAAILTELHTEQIPETE